MIPSVIGPLVAGLLVAFGLQVLLASVGMAAAVTVVKFLPGAKPTHPDPATPSNPPSRAVPFRVVGVLMALAVLLTINLVLFAACLLAVRLSATNSPVSGAILGAVIWSAYALIMSWIGARAIAVASGLLQKLVSMSVQGISSGTQTVVSQVVDRVTSTSTPLQEKLEGYMLHASRKQFSPQDIQEKLQEIVADPEYDLKTCHQELTRLKRQDFVACLQQRDDLSRKKIDKFADRLEAAVAMMIEQTESELDHQPDTLSSAMSQVLPSLTPPPIPWENLQLELLDWLKKYPVVLPRLMQLIFQSEWPASEEFSGRGDRVHVSQPAGSNPISLFQNQASNQLTNLKQQVINTFEVPYQLTLAAAWWLSCLAITTLGSSALAGALATHL